MPTMPNLVGMGLQEAEAALTAAGVLNQAALGFFLPWPIAARWVPLSVAEGLYSADSSNWSADSGEPTADTDIAALDAPPGTVVDQSLEPGASVAVNAALELTVVEYPMSVTYP